MKNSNSLFRTILSVVLASVSLGNIAGREAVAQDITSPCLPTLTTADLQAITCTVAAETYGITLYRLAICVNDPMASGIPDLTSCQNIINNPSGFYADIAPNKPAFEGISIPGSVKPNDGTYDFVYVQIGTTWKIKAQATVATGTWYTSSQLFPDGGGQAIATQNPADYAEFSNVLVRFSSGCQETNGYGGKTALLTAGLQAINPTGGSCPGAAFTAASANATSLMGSRIVITKETNRIKIDFKSTSGSIGLWAAANGTYVLGSRGFQLKLTTN